MTITRTTITAALPNWEVVVFSLDGTEVWYDPIIAWEITRDDGETNGKEYSYHCVTPLTSDGSPDDIGNLWAIKNPNGKITFPADRTCANETDALAYAVETIRRSAEIKAKMKAQSR